jgi:hypothetical protein
MLLAQDAEHRVAGPRFIGLSDLREVPRLANFLGKVKFPTMKFGKEFPATTSGGTLPEPGSL